MSNQIAINLNEILVIHYQLYNLNHINKPPRCRHLQPQHQINWKDQFRNLTFPFHMLHNLISVSENFFFLGLYWLICNHYLNHLKVQANQKDVYYQRVLEGQIANVFRIFFGTSFKFWCNRFFFALFFFKKKSKWMNK